MFFLEEFLEWFLSPEGGAIYLGMFVASWGVEATSWWTKFTKLQKVLTIVGVSGLLAAATIYAGMPAESLMASCELLQGLGTIDCSTLLERLFTVEGALQTSVIWAWSLIVHALNPYRKS